MKLRNPESQKMEVLYPGNLALLSMFLKNPDNEKDEIKKDERKKGDGPGECADVLTCGVCQKDFLLADILRFIQHKVHNCQAPTPPCGGQDTPSGGGGGGGEDTPSARPPSATAARDHNGDLGSESPSDPSSPAAPVKEEGDDCKADEKRKRDDEDDAPARKKPRSTQDAEANTTDSGEYLSASGDGPRRGLAEGAGTSRLRFPPVESYPQKGRDFRRPSDELTTNPTDSTRRPNKRRPDHRRLTTTTAQQRPTDWAHATRADCCRTT
nr:uncharacterized protein LOC113812006 [Penaeus vannamei]